MYKKESLKCLYKGIFKARDCSFYYLNIHALLKTLVGTITDISVQRFTHTLLKCCVLYKATEITYFISHANTFSNI